jgi:hypothetical protein
MHNNVFIMLSASVTYFQENIHCYHGSHAWLPQKTYQQWLSCWPTNYSRIPLIRRPQDQRGARLSNNLDYQTVPMTCSMLFCSFSISRQHFTTNIQLCSAMTFFKISQPALRQWALVICFHSIIKRLRFFNYHRPSHWFSFGTHCCKLLTQLVLLC